jgi:hypothetical protein
LILTDYPENRKTTTNAAVKHSVRNSGMPAVKIYGGFFSGKDVPLTDPDNAARVLVHELSHLKVCTTDERYRHARDSTSGERLGLKPGGDARFTTGQALNNADSWAFFAADCAGALTQKHLEWLKVV